jgi:hypothetical protein
MRVTGFLVVKPIAVPSVVIACRDVRVILLFPPYFRIAINDCTGLRAAVYGHKTF